MTVEERLRSFPGPGSGSARARIGRGEPSRRLVVVSNRVGPIAAGKASEGGLAVALRAALESRGGLWFGYSGSVSDQPSETPKIEFVRQHHRRDARPDAAGFRGILYWLCQPRAMAAGRYRQSLVGLSRRTLPDTCRVNRKFARSLAPMLTPG